MSATAAPPPARPGALATLLRWRDAVAPATPRPAGPARPWRLAVAACLALAALSLLGPHEPTYDPWAWIIWGREVLHGDLVTATGPSWKPLPVLFTTPFALFGDDVAPQLWLLVARAGGLLAFVMAYRLGSRLAGPWAGAIAAAALVLADEFIRNFIRGNSEGILVAACLWAIERHLDGRRRDAFALLLAAALLRPEVWPFLGLYGAWMVAAAWRARPPWRDLALVGGGLAALALLWFVPEYLGSGDLLRAASRAREPNPDSAAFAAFPFAEVFRRSASVLTVPVYAGGVLGAIEAALARRRVPLAMVAVATVLMVAVAAMTQGGFAGNLRYVALPAALVCVLAGAGWVWAVRWAAGRWGASAGAALAIAIAAASAAWVVQDARALKTQTDMVEAEADFYARLPAMIERAGGEDRIKACGDVYTGIFQVQALAYRLHMHEQDVKIFPLPPGTTFAPRYSALSRDPRFPEVAHDDKWIVGRSCAR